MTRLRAQIIFCVLFLLVGVRPAWGIEIFILPVGLEIFSLEVENSDSIESIRARIQDREGYPPEQQVLEYLDEVLEDGYTLSDYNIQSYSILYLTIVSDATATPTPTETATETTTPTSTASPTVTASHTSTATATSTSSATFTPTSTITATATATTTLTPSPTVTMTATSTVTSLPSVTPSATATSTPSPTVTVAQGVLEGRVVDRDGNPVGGVVVYLYRDGSQPSSLTYARSNQGSETGVLSTTTDSEGFYRFSGLNVGAYQVVPNFNGVQFTPSIVSVSSGTSAGIITAEDNNSADDSCSEISAVNQIVEVDSAARDQLLYALDLLEQFEVLAEERLRGEKLTHVLSRLQRSTTDLEVAYTQLLRQSEALPKRILNCGDVSGCRAMSLGSVLKAYRKRIDQLRALSLYLVRRVRVGIYGVSHTRDENILSSIRRLHRIAIRLSKQLPKQSDVCASL